MWKVSLLVTMIMVVMPTMSRAASINYADALRKSILFFEGQRSGKLPPSQRLTWRKDSALHDGSDIHINMVGGYYDAGDNVKFNFPMAFSTTMLGWSVIEFGDSMGSELAHALEAIRWGTDYFLKATGSVPDIVVAQVGDPNSDHICWERPEDMDTRRTSYFVTQQKPGSELAAEIAAALAASSIAFGKLMHHILSCFSTGPFRHRGSYNNSVAAGACPFYCDISGYMDELVWGAAWIYKATGIEYYWDFVKANSASISGNFQFGWDSKFAGIYVLVSQWAMADRFGANFISSADNFVCSLLPNSPTKSVRYSKGGLLFRDGGSNLQHATALSFLSIVYARYIQDAKKTIPCGNQVVGPATLVNLAKSQANYILGNNPLGLSYMVGYGQKFPRKIHHRGSTLPNIAVHPQHIGCHDGQPYFDTQNPNPNILVGAVTGGPAEDDTYEDSRYNVPQSEPTTYINAPFVGVLAYFAQPTITFTHE
ncbi:hypothetical protein Fmac_022796 [Flemingia macrophylla]|uniref:Endoglucanase n=1 Tax=Flemingia macrophylla TaxID=520843 RepID=A0ABD1M0Q5_9FABA